MDSKWLEDHIGRDMKPDAPPVQVITRFNHDEFQRRVPYQAVVEGWKKFKTGSVQRKYKAAFEEKERQWFESWHRPFHKWYISSGPPRQIEITLGDLDRLGKIARFVVRST